MIIKFKDYIKNEMKWSEEEFYSFYDRYITFHDKYRSNSHSVLYTEDYITAVLSLFFYVYRHRIVDKKSFLLALILNGLPFDKYNLHPNIHQSTFIKEFFETSSLDFISDNNKELTLFFCEAHFQDVSVLDYSNLYFDYLLFNDFRLLFKAVMLDNGKGLAIYHFNPSKIIFKVAPESYFDSDDFILNLEKNLNSIANLNIKDLYKEKIETFKIFLDKKKNNE